MAVTLYPSIHPSIHCSMCSAPVGVQCFLTSSLGEFLGYYRTGSAILGFRPCWCPSPFHSPSISRCFPFTLLHLPLNFIRLFLKVTLSAPRRQPFSLTWGWDQHRASAELK